jgi:hypothetical protein
MTRQHIKLIILSLIVFQVSLSLAVQPFGANYTEINSTRAPMDDAESIEALAGNVTEININGFSTTQSWQGYFGNVTGTIQLADASDNQMYNWSLASPEGEIYATTDTSVAWENIACFDLTGNHSGVETIFNIQTDDVDGLNETFSESGTHDEFFTNNVQFAADACPSTQIYDASGASNATNFQEVLMTDSGAATEIIFTAILDEEDVAGFDDKFHDFEMLVLEDGHGTNTATTTYYFYVEIE